MRTKLAAMLAGSSLLTLMSPALAQPAAAQEPVESASEADEAIVVTARRRDELLQDVPLTVNAVTGEQIEDLNIQRFEDIEALVPGLQMSEDSFATRATIRGVNFDTNVSGNNGTVEFYLNDAPVQSIYVLQSMFDIGQIEVLRGPQGTLRGRASPSGSITVAARRPDLHEMNGYVRTGISNLDNRSIEGAVSIPIIQDMLGIRVAGLIDQDVGNGVESRNSSTEPGNETQAGRLTIQFEPTDNLAFTLSHQRMDVLRADFTALESNNLSDPNAPASPITLYGEDREALSLIPNWTDQEFKITTLNAQYHFAGQGLYYVGSHADLHLDIDGGIGDTTNVFDPRIYTNAANGINGRGGQVSTQVTESQELRLQSDEPLFGFVDYVLGVFTKRDKPPTVLDRTTFVFLGDDPFDSTTLSSVVVHTPIIRSSESTEDSYFANLNFRIGDDTEFSIGGRHIEYESESNLIISGAVAFGHPRFDSFEGDIFQASLKHNFTDNFMVYASGGESFRPGTFAVGVFSLLQDQALADAQYTPPEESTSYEIGFKSEWFDNRVRLNASVYQQEFENYPLRTGGIYYIDYLAANQPDPLNPSVPTVGQFPMVAGVPLEVEGLEVEFGWQITDHLNVNATLAYADAQISGGRIPCTDAEGGVSDGIQDNPSNVPSLADLQNAYGGDFIAYCSVDEDATAGPPWSLSMISEYRNTLPVYSNLEGYIRGQLSVYDKDDGSPSAFDDVPAYGILNLYAGIASPDGRWDLMFFARNVTDEQHRTVSASPLRYDYRVALSADPTENGPQSVTTTYRSVNYVTPEREFGVNLRYNF